MERFLPLDDGLTLKWGERKLKFRIQN